MIGFNNHFSEVADNYAAFRPRYPAALFDYLAGLAPKRELAWDCAAGSGQATLGLAEHFKSVVATDASAAQIALAPPHPRVIYRVAPAENSGLIATSVDLITVAQALHWFDLERFYAEAKRVLVSGGVLAVWTYGMLHIEGMEIDQRIHHFYGVTLDPYWPPERKLVETGYRTLPFPFAELAPPQFAMKTAWPLPRLLGYFRSWSATHRFVAARGTDPVQLLASELLALWGDPKVQREICWPLSLRIGKNIA